MSKALSLDLGLRVPAAVADGLSRRAAAPGLASARQVSAGGGLWNAIGQACESYTPDECANYFAAAGYDPK